MTTAGVIGLGVMGKHHARIYNELGILHGVCDIDIEAARKVQNLYLVQCTDNVDEFLGDCSPDIVSVAVPTPYHVEVTEKCLRAGCDVLLEKPMAEDLEGTKKLVDLAEELERVLCVGYIETFNPAFQEALRMMNEDYFGHVTSVNIKRVGGLPRSADNVILDLMTHDFSLLLYLLDESPKAIHVHQQSSGSVDVVNSAQCLLDFGRTSATCEANWVSPVKIRQMAITGTEGYCEVDLIGKTVTVYEGDDFVKKKSFNKEPLKEEILNFVESHKLGVSLGVTASDGLEILRITLDAVEKGKES
jgi:UDP-N-acetylglucosamine 3-dehydrogenase